MKLEIYLNEVAAILAGTCNSIDFGILESACYNLILAELEDVYQDYSYRGVDAYAEALAKAIEAQYPNWGDALEDILVGLEQFRCDECGWWGHQGELLNEDGLCSDCAEEY